MCPTESQQTPKLIKDIAVSLFMGVNLVRVPKSLQDAEKIPVIHVKDVVDGVLTHPDELERIGLPDKPRYRRQRLLPGDLLVSARGTLMKCVVVPISHRGAIASANFIIVRLGSDITLEAELLCAFLRQPAVQDRVLSRVTNTAQAALTIRDLENLSVPLPPQDVQPALVSFLAVSDEQYRVAVHCARLRKEEAMDIVAQYMDPDHAS